MNSALPKIVVRGLILVAVAAFAVCARKASAQTDFERGNAAFESGKFEEAIKAYDQSIEAGVAGANVYFNLGNAWLRAGEKGRAILNYQRALALRPGHPEAAANLAFVQRMLNVPPPPSGTWSHFVAWMGIDAITVMTALGAWILLAGVVVRLGAWRGTTAGWLLMLIGAIPLVIGLAVIVEMRGGSRNPERAIVIASDGTKAHYAPADNSREAQVLPAGAEIRLLRDRGNWVYVEVGNGVLGWVSADDVETVVPRPRVSEGG
jgi:tetratricopeptide (TPR) repeat protein